MYIHVLHVYFLSSVHAGLGLRFVMCEHGASFESVCMISGVDQKEEGMMWKSNALTSSEFYGVMIQEYMYS